ncbi:hypothetical protein ABBQ32_011271 [Trebouxia sp. C0010 RCD-2024]
MATKPAGESQASTARRDELLRYQKEAQKRWQDDKLFEVNAPAEGETWDAGKFFGNFPYPYMNGMLHLGHAFSLSKLEFASAFHRLCGKKVLFPQGFHCTGMPIKACADKLERELQLYCDPNKPGSLPVFPDNEPDAAAAEAEVETVAEQTPKDPGASFKGKKSKAAAKQGTAKRQWEILRDSGIPEAEIADFRKSSHWLRYFPPLAMRDMTAMGCGIDWRRTFITTDVNQYYDSFVQWQFRVLKRQGRVYRDKRYAVYSPLDKQPCADHDRASGEGANPQEYILGKLKAVELTGKLAGLEGQGAVYFLTATLRGETFYGVVNAWVLPEGQYGAFRGLNNEIYIMSHKSALNLSYQDRMPVTGHPECLMTLLGQDLIGTPLKAPRSPHDRVYVLPLLTIKMNKGTGVVMGCPSDSPDDYTALNELKAKPKLREKFHVEDAWVEYDVIPVMEIPGLGNMAAKTLCDDWKIKTQGDKKLEEAKKIVYLKGFNEGVMVVGNYKGRKVAEVKNIIKKELIEEGSAILYSEPEKQVISRSGDECVVALTDQWYLTYGEEHWKSLTEQALQQMNTYSDEARHQFQHCLGWLNQWACSRSFGLGTRVPWDPQYLVESLSDSTVYMAYYTVAHFLQEGNLYGEGNGQIKAEDVTDEVWDYVLLEGPEPQNSKIPGQVLHSMRREFNYWYPFDLRASGKDLINNHLSFALYNHTAIWENAPEKWPKSMRCNGHLLLNGEKMSKSTGNFKTLAQAVEEYTADAMRLALADAGDGMEDANFVEDTADKGILRLTKELMWYDEALSAELRAGPISLFADRVFDNDVNVAVHASHAAYNSMMFKDALKTGTYDLQNARDAYRVACGPLGMHKDLVYRYIKVQTLLLTPICPHTCDHVWRDKLQQQGTVLTAGWPEAPQPKVALQAAAVYLQDRIDALRKDIDKHGKVKTKKGQQAPPAAKVVHADLYVSDRFTGWRERVLTNLSDLYSQQTKAFPPDVSQQMVARMKAEPSLAGMKEQELKKAVMPFAQMRMKETNQLGPEVLNVRLVFDEAAVLRENQEVLQRALDLQSVAVHMTTDAAAQRPEVADKLSSAEPGRPLVVLSTTSPQQQAQLTDGTADDPAQHIARLAVNGSSRT